MSNLKLTTKDIISIVLMSLVNIFIFGFSSLLYFNPFTILLMPVYFALAQGIVYFMLGAKVRKKGAMFIYCFIQGIVTFNIPYILCYLGAGIISEIILAKQGYGDVKALTASYVVMQVLNCIGSTLYPYVLTLDATISRMPPDSGVNSAYIEQAGHMVASWGCAVLIIVVIVSAFLGAFFGKRVMEKHLRKVQRAQEA